MINTLTSEVIAALSVPPPKDRISWKLQAGYKKDPQTGKPTRGLVVAYIDARDVQDRLDEVVGAENWSDAYTVVEINPSRVSVECRLTVYGITKADVGTGTKSGKDDPGDNLAKGAYSDALKRAAVKFGIGRFLYDLEKFYVDLDGNGNFANPQLKPHQYYRGNRQWVADELTAYVKRYSLDAARIGDVVKGLIREIPVEGLSLIETSRLISDAKRELSMPPV
jgi:hypothetical protein